MEDKDKYLYFTADMLNKKDVKEYLEYIEQNWKYAEDGGFVLRQRGNIIRFELHTFGYSMNEEFVSLCLKDSIFWGLFWQRSSRGGHYWFKINMKMLPK